MNVVERKLWYLRRLNLFAGMEPDEIEQISKRMRDRACQRREMILDPTSSGDRIFLVKRGAVRVYRLSSEGRELTTAILRPGQLFGTSALIGHVESGSFVEGLNNDAYICEASADEFLRIMGGHPVLAAKVTVLMARQLLHMEKQLEQLAFLDVPSRLAETLLLLAEENDEELPSNLTHEELAGLVGTTRETVTKTLSHFVSLGAVEVSYRHVAILDREVLRQQAEHLTT
jgi:CRP/FNR family transcriptional regulator, cyclic AMP receptor protein